MLLLESVKRRRRTSTILIVGIGSLNLDIPRSRNSGVNFYCFLRYSPEANPVTPSYITYSHLTLPTFV